MNSRNLKVYEKPGSYGSNIPSIRLQGKWLEKLGFKTGDSIKVTEEKEKLLIELTKDEDSGI